MLLSIITVCYNIRDEIERTCESIVNQTYQNFEWLIIDGGSTDGTLEILEQYKGRINVFISEKDKGVYDAMNKGIQKAQGKYINFMNGGDEFFSLNAIEESINELDGLADVVYGNCKICNYSYEGHEFIKVYPSHLSKQFFIDDCIGHQATFIKADLFNKFGLYDTSYRIIADAEKWLLFMSHNCIFKNVEKAIAIQYHGGLSSQPDSPKHKAEKNRMLEAYSINVSDVTVERGLFITKKIQANNSRKKTKYLLFNFIPLLKIQESYYD